MIELLEDLKSESVSEIKSGLLPTPISIAFVDFCLMNVA